MSKIITRIEVQDNNDNLTVKVETTKGNAEITIVADRDLRAFVSKIVKELTKE